MNDIGRAISPGGLMEPLSALPIKMKIDDVAKFEQKQQFAFSFAAKIDGLRDCGEPKKILGPFRQIVVSCFGPELPRFEPGSVLLWIRFRWKLQIIQ
ncbi:hypothetical protein quinque_013845 [Culex quinquefasciatus]